MRRFLTLAVVLTASVAYGGDFGVQLQVDVPLDPASISQAAANPLGYMFERSDALSLAAFYEHEGYGLRIDFLSATEVRFGLYRIMGALGTQSLGYQTDLGAYVGYNWRGDGLFLRLRSRIVLWGTTSPAQP